MWPFRKKLNLVIVCTANVTRSAFVAGLFRKQLNALPGRLGRRVRVISAGTRATRGSMANRVVALLARQQGFSLTYHVSRPFDARLAGQADLVLTMERRQKEELLEAFPALQGRVFTLLEYGWEDGGHEIPDIADPTGLEPENYEAFVMVATAEVDRVIEEIMRQNLI